MADDNRPNSIIRHCVEVIDEKTDDLLEIAYELEKHQVNVKLDNGRYLNPVSTIRSKVEAIWDEVLMISHEVCKGVEEDEV